MKYLFSTLIATFALAHTISAQVGMVSNEIVEVKDFTVVKGNTNLLINWKSNVPNNNDTWEVQGSLDGKVYRTIGLVMGADPKNPEVFAFKQKLQKIKPGFIYYRVKHLDANVVSVANIDRSHNIIYRC